MNYLSDDSKDAKKLLSIRGKLQANRQAVDELGAARLSDAEIKAKVRAGLTHYARHSAERLGVLAFDTDAGGKDVIGEVLNDGRGLAGLLMQQLEPVIVAAAIQHAGAEDAISVADRKKRIESLTAERHALEREEEVEVLRLEASGYTVARRASIDVAMVLSLWDKEPVTNAAA